MARRLPALTIVTVMLAVACGDAGGEAGLSLPPADGGSTISQAIGEDMPSGWIRGFIVAERNEPVRICEALAESFPPQCGGASLILRDGVIWREPYSEQYPAGEVTPSGGITNDMLTTDRPCGYEADGPCTDLRGVSANGDVFWTDVEYSVIGTIDGDQLLRLEAPPGADL